MFFVPTLRYVKYLSVYFHVTVASIVGFCFAYMDEAILSSDDSVIQNVTTLGVCKELALASC